MHRGSGEPVMRPMSARHVVGLTSQKARGGDSRIKRDDQTYLLLFCFLSSSSCCFLRMLRAIIRHVKFSMRCWFGSCCFVLVKNFQICVANGSSSCIFATLWLASMIESGKAGNNDEFKRPFLAVEIVLLKSAFISRKACWPSPLTLPWLLPLVAPKPGPAAPDLRYAG